MVIFTLAGPSTTGRVSKVHSGRGEGLRSEPDRASPSGAFTVKEMTTEFRKVFDPSGTMRSVGCWLLATTSTRFLGASRRQ